MASVLSVDSENDSDVAAMLAASAALEISDIPFKGPIAGVRVGRVDGAFVCNPSQALQEKSDLNLFLVGRKIVPGTEGRPYDVNLVMMEGGADEVAEDVIVDAINFGLEAMRPVIDLQDKMRQEAGKAKRAVAVEVVDEALVGEGHRSGPCRAPGRLRHGAEDGALCQARRGPEERRSRR